MIIYTSSQGKPRKEREKSQETVKEKRFKKILKNFQKSIDKRVCDMIYSLSCPRERESDWTLKIKQRDKKRNPRFDGKKPSRRVLKSTFQTVIRKLK